MNLAQNHFLQFKTYTMDLSELLLLLHSEVQKCYDYVDDSSRNDDGIGGGLHISMEKIEIELPISLAQEEIQHTQSEFKKMPVKLQKFKRPFDEKFYGDRLKGFDVDKFKTIKGKTLGATVLNTNDKLNENFTPEFTGKLRITLKPIVK